MASCKNAVLRTGRNVGHVTPKLGTAQRARAFQCLRRLTFAASTKFVTC